MCAYNKYTSSTFVCINTLHLEHSIQSDASCSTVTCDRETQVNNGTRKCRVINTACGQTPCAGSSRT